MTYPQQPGQPPYGQQPGWGPAPGPGGGYQQQGQFPPGGQYPGGQYPGGPGPQKSGRTGLVVGLGVVVVALAVFAVTAFVAPGFLLSDKDPGGTATGAADSGGSCGISDGAVDDGGVSDGNTQKINALVSEIVQGFCQKDQEALTQLICPGSEQAVQPYVDEVNLVKEFELTDVTDAGPTATAKVRAVLVDGEHRVDAKMTFTLAFEGDGFCWDDVEEG